MTVDTILSSWIIDSCCRYSITAVNVMGSGSVISVSGLFEVNQTWQLPSTIVIRIVYLKSVACSCKICVYDSVNEEFSQHLELKQRGKRCLNCADSAFISRPEGENTASNFPNYTVTSWNDWDLDGLVYGALPPSTYLEWFFFFCFFFIYVFWLPSRKF